MRRLNIPRNVENDTFYEFPLWGNWREREFWTFLRVRWSRNQLQTLHMKFHLGFHQQCQQGGAAAPDITSTSVMMFSTDWKKLSKYPKSQLNLALGTETQSTKHANKLISTSSIIYARCHLGHKKTQHQQTKIARAALYRSPGKLSLNVCLVCPVCPVCPVGVGGCTQASRR